MGKHFDRLVELLNKDIRSDERALGLQNVHSYLSTILKNAFLFELPLASKEIIPHSGKDKEEYIRYMNDYLDICKQYGKFLITPFELTAIEDLDSIVILDNINRNEYRVTNCYISKKQSPHTCDHILQIGDVKIIGDYSKEQFTMGIMPLYIAGWKDGKKYRRDLITETELKNFSIDLMNATNSYIEEAVYIMDPANFIIEKENAQSIKIREKYSRKPHKNKKLQKTIVRPHYICLSEDDTASFLKSESKEPRSIHPVRGHWRRLMSSRYVHKQGQRIPIAQHYRGAGVIHGKNGWRYKVMVKKDPATIVPLAK